MAWCGYCGKETGHDVGCPRYGSDIEYHINGALSVVSQIAPVPKPRMTRRDTWLSPPRPCVARYYEFKGQILEDTYAAGFMPTMDVYQIDVTAQVPMPKSWSKKKKAAHDGKPHRQTPDADNILKAVCDALLPDDSAVWSKSIVKKWAKTGSILLVIRYYK